MIIVRGEIFESSSSPAVGVCDRTGDIGSKASLCSLVNLRRIDLVLRACPQTRHPYVSDGLTIPS